MHLTSIFTIASCIATIIVPSATGLVPDQHQHSYQISSFDESTKIRILPELPRGQYRKYTKTTVGVGLHKMANQGSKIIVQRLDDREGDIEVEESNEISSAETETYYAPAPAIEQNNESNSDTERDAPSRLELTTTSIVILSIVGVFIILMFFAHEGSSVVATWDVTKQEKVISSELPGYLPVFIPMYNESTEEVERTCNNFRKETVANSFVRDELMVYFVVDNTRDCEAVQAVLNIAGEELDPDEDLPMQLGVPYHAGKLFGVPFKMFFKTESTNPDVIKGKRFSALLFSDLVRDDGESGNLRKAWATICLDADVVTFPYSIEHLVVQLLQNPNITVTCGNILPSVDQNSMASRIQSAEYFLQNRVVKNAEALFGVVTCCPGAFLLMEFESFRKTVQAAFSIDTEASSCLMRNALDLGEDRFLTSLLLIHKSKWTSFLPAANCTTQVPETFEALAKQRRRWFNSSLSNDIYIIRHTVQMFKSMMSRTLNDNRFVSILRFSYLMSSTIMRLVGACFSVLFSIMLMSSVSFILKQEGWCYGYFCNYYTFIAAFTVWVLFLIWSFHRAAANPSGFFERRFGLWLKINLGIATVLMTTGTVSIAAYGEALQGQLMAVTMLVLVGIYFFLVVNMSEHRSTFGPQLMVSLLVYLIIGLPFLAFMQPIVALSQVDNFNWGTRETTQKTGETSKVGEMRARRCEKIIFIFVVFALNAAVLFGVIESIGGKAMITTFCYVFLATQFLQVGFGMVRNILLIRQSKNPNRTKKQSYSNRTINNGGADTASENSSHHEHQHQYGNKSPKDVDFSDPEVQGRGVRDDAPVVIMEDNTAAHNSMEHFSELMYDDDSCY